MIERILALFFACCAILGLASVSAGEISETELLTGADARIERCRKADPRWLSDDPHEAYRLQLARIDDCVSRFTGLIDRWDVVNEATHFDRPEFLRRAPKTTGMWKTAGQIEFTRECFRHARQAHPNALLLINDYRTDPAYERVIEQLVNDHGHRLYDAIGIQSHMHGGVWPATKIWEVCERFARFGVPLHFTETTILSGPSKHEQGSRPSTPEGEARQAKEVERFYTLLFSHPAVEAITWWDFSDYRAWQAAPAGLIRADMTPKPAYESLLKLIKGTWWTQASLQADAAGAAQLRGFLGQYRVTVVAQGRRTTVDGLTLGKSANRWVVRFSESPSHGTNP
jgi:endo-1,4-beta-xylanase